MLATVGVAMLSALLMAGWQGIGGTALAQADNTPPSLQCTKSGTNALGQSFIEITVQDTDSGLQIIIVLLASNAVVSIPAFASGTTSPVVVTMTRLNQSFPAFASIAAFDMLNNTASFNATIPAPSFLCPIPRPVPEFGSSPIFIAIAVMPVVLLVRSLRSRRPIRLFKV